MKNWKKLFALLLAAALCLSLLAACGSSASSTDTAEEAPAAEETAEPAEEETTEEAEEPAEEEPAEEEPAEEEESDEDVTTIRYVVLSFSSNYDDKAVEEAINAITVPAINVAVDMDIWDMSTFMSQLSMEIAAGTEIDLASMTVLGAVSYNAMVSTGQLLALNDYLDQDYCSDIQNVVGEYLSALTLNGNIYGVPTYRLYCSNQYVQIRTDILDELGLTEDYLALDNWGDFKTMMETIRDNTELVPIGATISNTALYCGSNLMAGISTGAPFADSVSYDNLGDSCDILFGGDELTVSVNYTQDAFIEMCQTGADWLAEGLVYADIPTSEASELINGNVVAGDFITAETADDAGFYAYPVTRIETGAGMIKTAAVQGWGVFLPVTCAYPEETMKFVDLMYVNADLMNTLVYGVEGEDYALNDAGEAIYPEGVDTNNVTYRGSDFMQGNAFLCYPAEGYGADFRARCEEINAAAEKSEYLGFVLDTTELSDTIAAITATTDQYWKALTGGLYTEDLYSEFCGAMEAAGVNDYVAAVQAQVDAWASAQ